MVIDKTVYKNVYVEKPRGRKFPAISAPYRRVMNEVGKCLREGGWVEYEHRQESFSFKTYNVVDVTLYRNVNT